MKKKLSPLYLGLLAAVALPLVGCNATNDNPITPEKMEQIRQKEDSERRNFNPGNTPPPASTGTTR